MSRLRSGSNPGARHEIIGYDNQEEQAMSIIAKATRGLKSPPVRLKGVPQTSMKRAVQREEMRLLGIATGKTYRRALKAKKRTARLQAEADRKAPGVFKAVARGYRAGRKLQYGLGKNPTGGRLQWVHTHEEKPGAEAPVTGEMAIPDELAGKLHPSPVTDAQFEEPVVEMHLPYVPVGDEKDLPYMDRRMRGEL